MKSKVKAVRKHMLLYLLAFSVLTSLSVVKPVLADTPRVINVIPWDSGGNTMLNVTVYHDAGAEVPGHYVDNIEVNAAGNIQNFAQSGPHTYYDIVNHYFNVTVGPITGITGTPTTTVRAHDIVHGWSVDNWTGQIPEFTTVILFSVLILATTTALFVFQKNRTSIHRFSRSG